MRKVQVVQNGILCSATKEKVGEAEAILEDFCCTETVFVQERRGPNCELKFNSVQFISSTDHFT
jgi:hypothetical protein